MNNAKFKTLFLWELRNTPKRSLLWVVVGILFASFLWGATNAASLHRTQRQSIAVIQKADREFYDQVTKEIARNSKPGNTVLQYWQDQTDIDSSSMYFTRQHAIKPHLPLSVLSVGQGDLLPFILPVKLDTAFGVATSYDFEHPRILSLGVFDLSFAIVFFLPIGVILLVSMFGAFERDHGILRLAASQAVSPRMLLGSKMLALGVWLVPLLLLAVILALLFAGAPVHADLSGLGAALLVVGGYSLFWFTLAYLVLSLQHGAAISASLLIAIWAVFAVVVPKGATFALAELAPQGSHVLYIDKLRNVEKDVLQGGKDWNSPIVQWLDSRPEPISRTIDPKKLTYAAHFSFAAPERERRMQSTVNEMRAQLAESRKWTPLVEFLSPPAALQAALSTVAGNDPARQGAFTRSVVRHQHALRDFFYPRIRAQIINPQVSTCAGCPGRMTMTDRDKVPTYRFAEASTWDRVAPALLWTAIFALFSAILAYAALRRGRLWRAGELQ